MKNVGRLKNLSQFFSAAETFWENNFNIQPNCCDKEKILNEVLEIEKSIIFEILIKTDEKQQLVKKTSISTKISEKSEQSNKYPQESPINKNKKFSLKSKLSVREIEEIKPNKVEGKYRNKSEDETKKLKNIKESNNTNLLSNKWSKEEDVLLIRLCNSKLNKKWKKISEIIGTKFPHQCSYRYTIIKRDRKINLDKEGNDILLEEGKIKEYFKNKFGINLPNDNKDRCKLNIKKNPSTKSYYNSDSNTFPSVKTPHKIGKQTNNKDFLKINKPIFHDQDNFFDEYFDKIKFNKSFIGN